jgi:two-component system, chemotaxis family, protein-glutamate methylesterase/glutaminase
MIKVLVVEDSPVVQELLVHILDSDPRIEVAGRANTGKKALDFVARQKVDVITMDIHMPEMDGLEATRRIMETQPVPIIVVSASWNPQEVETTFRAMEAGAVAMVEKPRGIGHPDYATMANKLCQTVKAMSEVKVVRRWGRLRPIETPAAEKAAPLPPLVAAVAVPRPADIRLIAIGTSTGGPQVLQTILTALPKDIPAPVLIVQHIAAGFLQGLADWLHQTTGFPLRIATQGEPLLPGHAYLAPDSFHMGVARGDRIALSGDEPEGGLRPAVSYLFRSVAAVYGSGAVGVLLTGMGRDGAAELKLMKDKGAVTIAQNKETSIVHGMPGEAINLGAASYVLPPDRIVAMLTSLVRKS